MSQYKYLGVILDEHITFKEAAANRLDQATKAFWSIQGALSSVPGDAYNLNLLLPQYWTTVPLYGHTH